MIYFNVTGTNGLGGHEEFDNRMDIVQANKISEIKKLEGPFQNWYLEVVGSFYYSKINALVEGINNKIREIWKIIIPLGYTYIYDQI